MSEYWIQPLSWPALKAGSSVTSGRSAELLVDLPLEGSIKSDRVGSYSEILQQLSKFLEMFLQQGNLPLSRNGSEKLSRGSIARSARPCPSELGGRRERSSRRDPAKKGPALDAGLSLYPNIYYHACARHIIGLKNRRPRWRFWHLYLDDNSHIINQVAKAGKCMELLGKIMGSFSPPPQPSKYETSDLMSSTQTPGFSHLHSPHSLSIN